MSIKNGEPRHVFPDVGDADDGRVSVLHLDPPALHRGKAVAKAGAGLGLIVLLRFGLVEERTHSD